MRHLALLFMLFPIQAFEYIPFGLPINTEYTDPTIFKMLTEKGFVQVDTNRLRLLPENVEAIAQVAAKEDKYLASNKLVYEKSAPEKPNAKFRVTLQYLPSTKKVASVGAEGDLSIFTEDLGEQRKIILDILDKVASASYKTLFVAVVEDKHTKEISLELLKKGVSDIRGVFTVEITARDKSRELGEEDRDLSIWLNCEKNTTKVGILASRSKACGMCEQEEAKLRHVILERMQVIRTKNNSEAMEGKGNKVGL